MKPRSRRTARIASIMLLGSVSIAACPNVSERAPAQTCAKADDKCVLPSGVLGVCNIVDCAAGQLEPCLICRSQH
jgi:hypothetical protein